MGHIQATGFYMIHQWIAVENLTATAISDTRIDLAWDIIQAGMTGIVIEWSTDGITFEELDFVGGTETSYSATGLTTNTHYYSRIRGVKASTYSEYSNTADDWTAWKFTVEKTGDGTERGRCGWTIITENIYATIDGNGLFYTASTGGTGSTVWNMAVGNEYRYIEVSDGTSNILVFHKNNITIWGSGNLGGGSSMGWLASSSNQPKITLTTAGLIRSLTSIGLGIYGPPGGVITGSWADLPSDLTSIYINGTGCNLTGAPSDLPVNLEILTIISGGNLTGNCNGFPDSVKSIYLTNPSGNISGSVSDLPSNLQYIVIQQGTTLTGNVSGFPQNDILYHIDIAGSNTITGDITGIEYSGCALDYVSISGQNTISGTIGNLSVGTLTSLLIRGNNTITGDIGDLDAAALTSINIGGKNTISGNIDDLPSGITQLNISGSNTIAGTIASLPSGLLSLTVHGSNTITGSIALIPSTLISVYIIGNNTISGNISGISSAMTVLIIAGSNTIAGNITNLPATLTRLEVYGNNTLSGNVNAIQSALRTFRVDGQNTITGTIAGIPGTVTDFAVNGLNTLSGDLADIGNAITGFVLQGQNTVNTYTSGKTWSNVFANTFYCIPVSPGGLDATEIDNLFIDLDTSWTTTRSQIIDMRGTNAAPTAASAAARASLVTKGRTIYTN